MTSIRPKGAGIIAGVMGLGAVAALFFACEAPRPTAPPHQEAAAKLSPGVDSLALLPWVREGLQQHWSELLAEKSGDPVDVWFYADPTHRILGSQTRLAMAEHGQPSLSQVEEALGEGASRFVRGVMIGGAHGWARSNVSVVWVTLHDSSGVHELEERVARYGESREHGEPAVTERMGAEAMTAGEAEESRARLREAVAKYYPQYLTQHANPPIVLWFSENSENGALQHEQTLRTPGEGVGPVPADMGGGASLFKGWLTIGSIAEHRPDVTLVWVHHGRPPKEDSESH